MAFKNRVVIEGNKLSSVLEQTDRALILDTVRELRKAEPVKDRPGLGRWALSVPLEDMQGLRMLFPDLAATDAQVRSAAWRRFINSPISEPYRVRDKV